MSEWKPIETIPDETVVVWMNDLEGFGFPMVATVYDRSEPMSFVNDDGEHFPPSENGCWPVYWMPLPPPPTGEKI